MSHVILERTVKIPDSVSAEMTPIRSGQYITIKGPKGTLERSFERLTVHLMLKDDQIVLSSHFGAKHEAAMLGTIEGHIKNMIKGVTTGFEYRVQVITSHFPATVEVQKDAILIKNLYGRRNPIRVPYDGSRVKVVVKGDMVTFTGINIEHVSQAAARVAESTRLRGSRSKDPTVFQDGLYVVYP